MSNVWRSERAAPSLAWPKPLGVAILNHSLMSDWKICSDTEIIDITNGWKWPQVRNMIRIYDGGQSIGIEWGTETCPKAMRGTS
jgi:hypothetical protein